MPARPISACFHCGSQEHMKKECPFLAQEQLLRGARPLPECWHCGSRAHTKFECPVLEQDQEERCWQCGSLEHMKKDCPDCPKLAKLSCWCCNAEGHTSANCPSCRYCKAEGHKASNCPELAKRSKRSCRYCGTEGHIAATCPKRLSPEKRKKMAEEWRERHVQTCRAEVVEKKNPKPVAFEKKSPKPDAPLSDNKDAWVLAGKRRVTSDDDTKASKPDVLRVYYAGKKVSPDEERPRDDSIQAEIRKDEDTKAEDEKSNASTTADDPELVSFLKRVGPQFDPDFISTHSGAGSYNALITFTHAKTDLKPLVDAGMKPLHVNMLFAAIRKEPGWKADANS